MITQKIIQVGNSWAVTIPPELAEKYNLSLGMKVVSHPTEKGILYTPVLEKSKVSKEFKDWLNKRAKKYGPALRELASK